MDFVLGNTSLCLVLGSEAGNTSLAEVSKCWDCEEQFDSSGVLLENLTSSTNCTECLQNICSEFVTKKNWYRSQSMLSVAALMGILILLGIPGNTIVLVVYYFKDKKTTANKFMMALASIDLHACLVIHPYIISKLFNFYSPNTVVCKIFEYLIYVTQASQGLTLVAVAVDRYHAVMKPLAFGYAAKAAYMIPACLSIAASGSIPIILFYGQKTVWLYDQQKEGYIRTHVCHYSDEYDGSQDQLIYILTTMVLLLLIVMVISVLYTLIAVKLRKRNAQVGPLGVDMRQLECGSTNSKMQDLVAKVSKQSLDISSTEHLNEQGQDPESAVRVKQSITISHDLIADIDLISAFEDEPISHCSSSAPPIRVGALGVPPLALALAPPTMKAALEEEPIVYCSSSSSPSGLTALEDEPIAHCSSSVPPIRITAFKDEPKAHCSTSVPPIRATFNNILVTRPSNVQSNQDKRVQGTILANPVYKNPAGFKGCKLLFTVTLVFFASWLPFWVLRFLESGEGIWEEIRLTNALLSHLFFLNNAINPILYAFINKKFREECRLTKKKILTRLRYLCC